MTVALVPLDIQLGILQALGRLRQSLSDADFQETIFRPTIKHSVVAIRARIVQCLVPGSVDQAVTALAGYLSTYRTAKREDQR